LRWSKRFSKVNLRQSGKMLQRDATYEGKAPLVALGRRGLVVGHCG
jgi:hypothetical protein